MLFLQIFVTMVPNLDDNLLPTSLVIGLGTPGASTQGFLMSGGVLMKNRNVMNMADISEHSLKYEARLRVYDTPKVELDR